MLVGTYYHTLESKGRFSLPKCFRDQATDWVLTSGLDGCIFIFKKDSFEAQAAKLAELSYYKADHRALIRHFAASASEQTLDNLGRLSVPENLRHSAGLTKNIVVVGALDHLEVWDTQRYHDHFDALEQVATQAAERVEI